MNEDMQRFPTRDNPAPFSPQEFEGLMFTRWKMGRDESHPRSPLYNGALDAVTLKTLAPRSSAS